jgi:hypothetical protein
MSLTIGFLGSRKNSLIEARLLAGILRRFRIVLSMTAAKSIFDFNMRAGNRPEKTALISPSGLIVHYPVLLTVSLLTDAGWSVAMIGLIAHTNTSGFIHFEALL